MVASAAEVATVDSLTLARRVRVLHGRLLPRRHATLGVAHRCLVAAGDGCPNVIVLGNASIRHGTDEATREHWLLDHKALLFYLPVFSPEPNMIEIDLKYRWGR
ncbi:hypothetical protein [Burkholderia pyrrocinia]|uniref:hypothetical protein n=1 Tax=Burkholderia pyrrocinia TaxID=60550 RepID=UPI001588CAA4|nr:hypothetical protein [Burkholderia pyrrocinia]